MAQMSHQHLYIGDIWSLQTVQVHSDGGSGSGLGVRIGIGMGFRLRVYGQVLVKGTVEARLRRAA